MTEAQTINTNAGIVDGWLHPAEGRLLFHLARNCAGRGAVVEVGSWKGKSTIQLARGALAGSGAKVHAIDPHTGSPEHSELFGKVWTFHEFEKNIEVAGVKDAVVPHVDFSDAVARTFSEPVGLAFIDGLHEFEGVKTDFDAWFPHVLDGGVMAFHDTTCWPGVLKVVVDDLFRSRRFRKVRFVRSIVYGQKVARNTAFERLENRLVLGAFLIHAWMDRMTWRLVHRHLDCAAMRALVRYIKRRQGRTASA